MRRRGFFITLEGPEGSGKSSQVKPLVSALRTHGCSVVAVHDPGTTPAGKWLRSLLLHRRGHAMTPMTEAFLFIAGRIQLVRQRIAPALKRGAVVVCDRFHDSTIAYQGYGGQLDVQWLDRVGRHSIGGIMPDLTIILDVPTRVGFARLHRARDRMESKARAFHERVRRGFLAQARRNRRRIVVVDATQPQADIHKKIVSIVWSRVSQGLAYSGQRIAVRKTYPYTLHAKR